MLSQPQRTSTVLASLARGNGNGTISIREIVQTLGERGFALLVALLGLPNCIPMVPPIPLICGFLLGFVAVQMMIGRAAPWLPRRLLDRSVPSDQVQRAVERVLPYVLKLETFSSPRLTLFNTRLAERVIGCVLLLIALGLLVAAPIIGQIPLGIAACLIGFGLVERDGVVVAIGTVVGAIGLSLSLGFAFALLSGIASMLRLVGVPV